MHLNESLKKYFASSKPLFEQLMNLHGICYRKQKGRTTQRVTVGENDYFIKQHQGIGWKEIFKNLIQGRFPVISAHQEWQALTKLAKASISVPDVLGYGEQGLNPAKRQSFILMQALTATISLEELSQDWCTKPPSFKFKQQLISQVATIARRMHDHGINHRDFYICHFLMDNKSIQKNEELKIYLIDLHRAQCRKKIPMRWLIKDLAGLYFSSQDRGLTKRDFLRFIKQYDQQALRESLSSKTKFWKKVKERGDRLYDEHTN